MNANKLLIVDDSPYIHKMVRAYLEPDPVIIHSSYNGQAGLASAVQLNPGLVLMDIDMPELNGLDTCRRFKADPHLRHTPVMFLTADCSTGDKVKAFEMGAIDYVTKPFKPEELRARVNAALRTQMRVQSMALTDPLTGLWNQSYLDIHMPAQISLAEHTGQTLACIMVKVDTADLLRSINSTTERTIQNIATALMSLSKVEDIVCHVGDGLFVLLQPATDHLQATRLAWQMRDDIEHLHQNWNPPTSAVTCSFGVSDSRTNWLGSMLDSAEACLRGAESAGGNRVISASSLANGSTQAA